jgi:hypothetical protein
MLASYSFFSSSGDFFFSFSSAVADFSPSASPFSFFPASSSPPAAGLSSFSSFAVASFDFSVSSLVLLSSSAAAGGPQSLSALADFSSSRGSAASSFGVSDFDPALASSESGLVFFFVFPGLMAGPFSDSSPSLGGRPSGRSGAVGRSPRKLSSNSAVMNR